MLLHNTPLLIKYRWILIWYKLILYSSHGYVQRSMIWWVSFIISPDVLIIDLTRQLGEYEAMCFEAIHAHFSYFMNDTRGQYTNMTSCFFIQALWMLTKKYLSFQRRKRTYIQFLYNKARGLMYLSRYKKLH